MFYNPQEIEIKQRTLWAVEDPFIARPPSDTKRATYVKSSAIFPSGPLHLGHARHLTLCDTYARFRRLKGDAVLFTICFDAFGQTAARAAKDHNLAPTEWIERCTTQMTKQALNLGCSLDLTRGFTSSDPSSLKWSQWLYIKLYEMGLMKNERAERVDLAIYLEEATKRLEERRESWNRSAYQTARSMEAAAKESGNENIANPSLYEASGWGAPVPLIHCMYCGAVPVPEQDLPVLIGENKAVFTNCPLCGRIAKRDLRVISSRFDALWLWLLPCVPPEIRSRGISESLKEEEVRSWLPSSQLIAGSDSGRFVLHQRLVTRALRDIGPLSFLEDGEPFARVTFHEMVTSGGNKMSKSLGNGVTPDELLAEYGADALRLTLLALAPLQKPLHWDRRAAGAQLRFHKDCLDMLWRRVQTGKIEGVGGGVLREKVLDAYERQQFHLVVKRLTDAILDEDDVPLDLLEPLAPHICASLRAS